MFANLEQTSAKTQFDIDNIDVSIVNALRRVILSDVPTIGFSFDPTVKENDIVVHQNTGVLHNEFLAHRVSLVPLYFTSDEIENFIADQYKFVLKVSNETDGIKEVTTKDIMIYEKSGVQYPKEFRDRIFPANPITGDHILLTKLKPNLFDKTRSDEIYLEAYASKNVGRVHSRWSPVSLCTYFNNIDENAKEEGYELFKKKNTGLSEEELSARFKTLEQYRYYKKNEHDEACSFHFEIKSVCNLRPTQIFQTAIKVLIKKLQKFIDNVNEKTGVSIEKQRENNMFYVSVEDEDHTLGNLIQAMFYNIFIRKDFKNDEDLKVSYIGYFKPHPLEDSVLFKIQTDEKDVRTVLTTGTTKIINFLSLVLEEWKAFVNDK